jgi:hypothetical protein
MSGTHEVVVVPSELSALVAEREKVWTAFDMSQNLSDELNKLSSQVPQCAPAELQLPFGSDIAPPDQLAAVLPLLKEKIETARKLNANVQSCHNEIAAIKQREKMIIMAMAAGGVVLLLVLFFVAVSFLS